MPTTIRSRAPLRLGLAGGGTDVSPFSDEHGGYVLNATIDLYAQAILEPRSDGRVAFVAADRGEHVELAASKVLADEEPLRLHRGIYNRIVRQFNAGRPLSLTLTTYADAPAGSGLGTSSTMVVAMVRAYVEWLRLGLGEYEVARIAYEIERLELGLAGGKQDQYAAAFGGTNFMEFLADERVIVNPLRVAPAYMNELESALVTCFTGVSRRSEQIIEEQQKRMSQPQGGAIESLHQLKRDAIDMKQALLRGEIAALSTILNRSWAAKQRTASGISTERIETLFEVAMRAGARAGKVSGAGGGGFMMFLGPPEAQVRLIRALNEAGGTASPVHFTDRGAESWLVPQEQW